MVMHMLALSWMQEQLREVKPDRASLHLVHPAQVKRKHRMTFRHTFRPMNSQECPQQSLPHVSAPCFHKHMSCRAVTTVFSFY